MSVLFFYGIFRVGFLSFLVFLISVFSFYGICQTVFLNSPPWEGIKGWGDLIKSFLQHFGIAFHKQSAVKKIPGSRS
jgi:hypothetical protein